MKRLVSAAAACAALCGAAIGMVATEFGTPARAASASVATIDVYKDAS